MATIKLDQEMVLERLGENRRYFFPVGTLWAALGEDRIVIRKATGRARPHAGDRLRHKDQKHVVSEVFDEGLYTIARTAPDKGER